MVKGNAITVRKKLKLTIVIKLSRMIAVGKAPANLNGLNSLFYVMRPETEEDKIKLLQKLHQQMIEEILDYAIILLDLDGTILTWNKGAEKIKGYKEEEIIGQNFRIFYMPHDRQAQLPEALLNQAIKEGRAKHIGRRLKKDGSTFWGRILITALHDDEGNVVGFTKLTKELGENDID